MRKYYVIHAVIVTESVIRLVRPHILTMAMLGANSRLPVLTILLIATAVQ